MHYRRLLATTFLAAALMGATEARAVFIIDVEEVDGNVVATGGGSLDLTALTPEGSNPADVSTEPNRGYILTGAVNAAGAFVSVDIYSGLLGPASFGSGDETFGDLSTGDDVGIWAAGGNILDVPIGYTSNSPLSSSETWDGVSFSSQGEIFAGATFSSLGMTEGTYTWTWGTPGVDADSFVVQIGPVAAPSTPEPASLALFGAGLAALGAVRRRKSM